MAKAEAAPFWDKGGNLRKLDLQFPTSESSGLERKLVTIL